MLEKRILGEKALDRQWERAPISTASSRQTLESLPNLFRHSPGMLGIMRRCSSEGVWTGNGSSVHPGAILIPPVYIGNHVRVGNGATIGPNAVVGDGCVIDEGSRIAASLIMPGTYIGRDLDVADSIVESSLLANLRLGAVTRVPERSLLAGVRQQGHAASRPRYAQRLIAALLWALTWPVARALAWRSASVEARGEIGVPDEATGGFKPVKVGFLPTHETVYRGDSGAWTRHFLRTFHPGLRDVVAGRVDLLGMQPRSCDEIVILPDYWKRLYWRARTGLINDTLLLGEGGGQSEMRHAGDALCAAPHSLIRTFRMLATYARRVALDIASAAHKAPPLGETVPDTRVSRSIRSL
jgi:carbonic anhydrase/acetyltransferase-like protein (isoleucine patch superfamily)